MNFLDQFAAFLDEPNVKSSLSSPASEQGIQQVENALGVQARICGFKMPPSYRAFLLRYDGGNVDWESTSAEWDGGPIGENGDSEGELLEYHRPEEEDDDEGAWIYIDFLSVGESESTKAWERLMYHNSDESVFMNHESKRISHSNPWLYLLQMEAEIFGLSIPVIHEKMAKCRCATATTRRAIFTPRPRILPLSC